MTESSDLMSNSRSKTEIHALIGKLFGFQRHHHLQCDECCTSSGRGGEENLWCACQSFPDAIFPGHCYNMHQHTNIRYSIQALISSSIKGVDRLILRYRCFSFGWGRHNSQIYHTMLLCTHFIIHNVLGCPPLPVTVTTRIITFLVGDPYNPSFATVTGRGDNPNNIFIVYSFFSMYSGQRPVFRKNRQAFGWSTCLITSVWFPRWWRFSKKMYGLTPLGSDKTDKPMLTIVETCWNYKLNKHTKLTLHWMLLLAHIIWLSYMLSYLVTNWNTLPNLVICVIMFIHWTITATIETPHTSNS